MDKKRDGWTSLEVDTPGSNSFKLFDFLRKNIKGQDDAIKDLSDAIEIREAGFQEDDKPIYRGLFMGPSGVGKTLVAELLGEFWLNSRVAITRIACESYSEPHSISRLIGSPPGYIGFNAKEGGGGALPILAQENIDKWAIAVHSEKESSDSVIKKAEEKLKEMESSIFRLLSRKFLVDSKDISVKEADNLDTVLGYLTAQRLNLISKLQVLNNKAPQIVSVEKPISIILFDELEKASTPLHNIVLNVLDKAALTMANGAVTRFNNSVIIATSNANSRIIADLISEKSKIGFLDIGANKNLDNLNKQIYEKSMRAANGVWSTEFLARFDRISVFHPLSESVISEIFDIEFAKFEERYLKPLLVFVEIGDAVKKFVISEATDKPQNGARLLKQKISKYLKKQIARLKNRNELLPGDKLHLLLNSNKRVIEFYKEPGTRLLLPGKSGK